MANAVELAKAKVNLTLHIIGQRDDGLHLLDSLVVFPMLGDVLRIETSSEVRLTIDGPFGAQLSADDNLVLDAAKLMQSVSIKLTKNLPVAAGIGGGSADAAATIRAICKISGTPAPPGDVLAKLGADIPVCLLQQPCRMRGIGDEINPIAKLPSFWLVLVNTGDPVATGEVFKGLRDKQNPPMQGGFSFQSFAELAALLRQRRNDLEVPAVIYCPVIKTVLDAISVTKNCALARMSGSGGTCFGLYETEIQAQNAATQLGHDHPSWWIKHAVV